MFTRFICQNDFHPLSTSSRGAADLRLKHLSSKQEILNQIGAVPHFQSILWFVIMFARIILQNDFRPLSTNSRGCGIAVKAPPREISASSFVQIILWFVIMFTLFVFQNDFHPLSNFNSLARGLAVKAPV